MLVRCAGHGAVQGAVSQVSAASLEVLRVLLAMQGAVQGAGVEVRVLLKVFKVLCTVSFRSFGALVRGAVQVRVLLQPSCKTYVCICSSWGLCPYNFSIPYTLMQIVFSAATHAERNSRMC